MIYFQLTVFAIIFVYLYIAGYIFGIPKALKHTIHGLSDCRTLKLADKNITSIYNINVRATKSDIIKEKMRLDCEI